MDWYLYIAKCADGSLYTGIAKDIEKRIKTHNAGRGAFYTKNKLPIVAVYSEFCGTNGDALRREREVKKMTRDAKLKLIENFQGD